MSNIPILSGVYGSEASDFSISYPLNLEPVFVDSGLSKGCLRAAAGVDQYATGPDIDRGGINWNGQCYRVMGSKLVRIENDASVTVLGDVGDGDYVALDYSFDRLAVGVPGLSYWNGMTFTPVTDPDLGQVIDMLWMDSYFITTDGNSIVVTELANPLSIDPLKYGSAEEDPDMVTGLIKLREELYVLGRYTIQVFGDAGTTGFPFANKIGAGIPKGCVGPAAKAEFDSSFAFVGSGRNEANGVYVAGSGTAVKISTRRIDDELAKVVDEASIKLEVRSSRNEQRLFLHLPGSSWVFLATASREQQAPVWYEVSSGSTGYRPRNAVLANGKWIVGDADSPAIGVLTDTSMDHFGDKLDWGFDTQILKGPGIIHSLELVGLPGRARDGDAPEVTMSITRDGETYSVGKTTSLGVRGQRGIRAAIRPHWRIPAWAALRFRGRGGGMPGVAALDAEIEPLA